MWGEGLGCWCVGHARREVLVERVLVGRGLERVGNAVTLWRWWRLGLVVLLRVINSSDIRLQNFNTSTLV